MAIRLMIADDADLSIIGAQTVLESDHRYQVVGTARDVPTLLEQVCSHYPDVLLLGEWLYPGDVLNTVQQLRRLKPKLRIIVIGGLVDGLLIRDLFQQGAKGYLYRSDDLQDCLSLAVDTVLRDRPFLSPTANAEYLIALQAPRQTRSLDAPAQRVLQGLAQGLVPGEIAARLGLTRRQVYGICERLRLRFAADTNAHLVSRAAAEGFFYLETV